MTVAVIAVMAVFFFAMGAFALVSPHATVRPFGITLPEPASRSEVRAVYGGYGVATGAILTVAAFDPGFHRSGITITVAVALARMAVGRLVSAVVDKRTAFYPNWFYFGVETVGATALLTTA